MKGITKYVTASGVRVARLHYSAHPKLDQDTPDGLANLMRIAKKYPGGGMQSLKFLREMEIRFDIRGSGKVWADFMDRIQPKITCAPFEIPPYWPVRAGYDYGSTNPFAFVVIAYESEDRFYQIDEIYETGLSPFEQAKLMREKPYWKNIQQVIGDPSIWTRNQHQADRSQTRSIGDLFEEMEVFIDKGDNQPGGDLTFRDLLNSHLWRNLERPQFMIFNHCQKTLREMRLLRYKEWATKMTQEKSNNPEEIVGKDNHAWDALKYLILATHAEAPARLDYPENSWGRLFRDIRSMKERARLVLS